MDAIPSYIEKLLANFDGMRGKPKETLGVPFWDVVVLTASDEAQKLAYELQLQDKLEKGHLPTDLPYLVYADPPGPKVGCGGCTMFVINQLEQLYGREQLTKWRILLLNAGGQSQRLPCASVLGKIFTALPVKGKPYQMLDIKLALYLPFLERMSPGYFHPASDCIEVYALDDDDVWSFNEPGVTALAHPSSLKTGTGHGVYVLEEREETSTSRKAEMRECIKVLQKPSIEVMKRENAILKDSEENEFVYTDSVFFFDHAVATRLVEFYKKEAPLNCEIDSYGDFLQPLGPQPDISYTTNTANVRNVESNLIEIRQKVFHLLKGTPLHIVMLNASKFYHYGTFDEYLFHLTQDKKMIAEMNLTNIVNCRFKELSDLRDIPRCRIDETRAEEPRNKLPRLSRKEQQGCLMHSVFSESYCTSQNCIVEFCNFGRPLTVGDECVISNCEYTHCDIAEVVVPARTFMHSVSVKVDGEVFFVTVLFNIKDNLKKALSFKEAKDLQFCGRSLGQSASRLGRSLESIFPGKGAENRCTLWEARLFPLQSSLSASFQKALEMLRDLQQSSEQVHNSSPAGEGEVLMSMDGILKHKDIQPMLDFRRKLDKLIKKV